MALLADSWDTLEVMLTSLSTHCQDFGLSISCAKDQDYGSFSIQLLATTRAYPSFPQQDNCGTDLEVNSRICKASQAFGSLSCTLWYQKKIRTHTKLYVHLSFLCSPHTAAWHRECCAVRATHPSTAELHDALFADHPGHICLEYEVQHHYPKTGSPATSLLSTLFPTPPHVSRMSDSRLPKKLLVCDPFGSARSVGGQKCRWNDLIQHDLVRCGIQEDWCKLSQDKSAW